MWAQLPLGAGVDAVGKRYTNCKKAREPKKGKELKKKIKKKNMYENYKLQKNRL